MNTEPINVSIVEDNEGLRASLREMIEKHPDLLCASTHASAEDALTALPTVRPDVVLMDINLPGMNGVECVVRCTVGEHVPQFLILTVSDNDDNVFNALAAGASGYLLKPVRADQLATAIKDVHAGGAPMSPSIARRVVQAFQKPAPPDACDKSTLTPREHEILKLLAKGFLLKEIATELGISYWTVQTHVLRTYEKLHVRSRAQAVAKYLGQDRA